MTDQSTPATANTPNYERRSSARLAIEREAQFKVLTKKGVRDTGTGMTVNISSSGILLRTENVLLPGKTVEVAVSWPEKLNGNCSLKLVTRGRVVRCGRGVAAIVIKGYEFRTAAPVGRALSAARG